VWSGDPHSQPLTVGGSLKITHGLAVCHSFVVEGTWQFLTDCTHRLAGVTVPLEPLPDWLVD
jgi:hypothetical protein